MKVSCRVQLNEKNDIPLFSTEETNSMNVAVEVNQKTVRATSAPRPRAVLSSPGNLHCQLTLCTHSEFPLA